MQAMQIEKPGSPLQLVDLPIPEPRTHQIRVKVTVCGLCRTDLHVLDGELKQTRYPIVPGHQVVGTIDKIGPEVADLKEGDRVGIPWLAGSCLECEYCAAGKENLCPQARFTGCQINGGFAQYCVADARYCFALPENYTDLQVAPLLCAGLIGYRAYRMTGNGQTLGLMGFGASAHILAQLAKGQGKSVFAFTREDDTAAQDFALGLGATWAGSSAENPPQMLDAIIIFAPDGKLVPRALSLVKPGGIVVCAGIHMSTIPAFSYDLLWQERTLCSVANLTRQDGVDFMALAKDNPVHTEIHPYPLAQVNQALNDLRHGKFTGAAVIRVAEE